MDINELKNVLFVDLETVSNAESFTELDEDWQKLWKKQVEQSYRDATESPAEMYIKKASLHAEFGKIVCLGMGCFNDANGKLGFRVKVLKGDEKSILSQFKTYADKLSKLCSHNGKKFDFPYLARRAYANGVPLAEAVNVQGKKPWETDLIDTMEMWRFGDTVYPSLNLLCKVFGIEGKGEFDGSMVHNTFYVKKDIDTIAKYCAHDVISVAKVYLKLIGETLPPDGNFVTV